MGIETEWTPDFCLACDRQTSGGAYCSQSCRLADIESSSTGVESISPSSSASNSWTASHNGGHTGFYLPPSINFDAYRSQPAKRTPSSASAAFAHVLSLPPAFSHPIQSSRPSRTGTSRPTTLTPSSSRSSLSSLQSTSSQESGSLSDQARHELRNYANSFDQHRDWKRRVTLP